MTTSDRVGGFGGLVICGHARLSDALSATYGAETICIEVAVDRASWVVSDLSVSVVGRLLEQLLRPCVVGRRLEEGVAMAIQRMRASCAGIVGRAVVGALHDLNNQYHIAMGACGIGP